MERRRGWSVRVDTPQREIAAYNAANGPFLRLLIPALPRGAIRVSEQFDWLKLEGERHHSPLGNVESAFEALVF